MRRLLCILTLLSARIICTGQTSFTIDLSSILYTELHIDVGYAFADHWSFSTSAGINLKMLRHRDSNVEISHNSEYPINRLPDPDSYLHRESLKFCYWPKHTYESLFISIGAEYRDDCGIDANIGLGYLIPVWKGLKLKIKYEAGIIRSVEAAKLSLRDLYMGISWVF